MAGGESTIAEAIASTTRDAEIVKGGNSIPDILATGSIPIERDEETTGDLDDTTITTREILYLAENITRILMEGGESSVFSFCVCFDYKHSGPIRFLRNRCNFIYMKDLT